MAVRIAGPSRRILILHFLRTEAEKLGGLPTKWEAPTTINWEGHPLPVEGLLQSPEYSEFGIGNRKKHKPGTPYCVDFEFRTPHANTFSTVS